MNDSTVKGRIPTPARMLGVIASPVLIMCLMFAGGSDSADSLLAMVGFIIGLIAALILIARQGKRINRSNVGWLALLGAVAVPLLFRTRDEAFSIGQTFGTGIGIGVLALIFTWIALAIGKKESAS